MSVTYALKRKSDGLWVGKDHAVIGAESYPLVEKKDREPVDTEHDALLWRARLIMCGINDLRLVRITKRKKAADERRYTGTCFNQSNTIRIEDGDDMSWDTHWFKGLHGKRVEMIIRVFASP